MPLDYSKWDNIEISDDEDDTHPNVDTPSLYKWRHEARVQREDEYKTESAKKNASEKLRTAKIDKLTKDIAQLSAGDTADEANASKLKGLQAEHKELTDQQDQFQKKEAELAQKEKDHPTWNVDNMSNDKHNRTIINSGPTKTAGDKLELTAYFKEHGDEVKAFGMFSKYEESHKYLKERMHLVCDHLASYLVIWAVDLEVEKKEALMKRVARQAIVAQYILELAKTLQRDPRSCVEAFFTRIKTAEKQYTDAFEDEYNSLLERVRARAIARHEEAKKEAEEEEKQEREKRLGPGGLDPLEIIKQIPANMKEAFETQNTPMLQQSFADLPDGERERVYKMVVDSGLWVPQGGGDDEGEDDGAEAE